MSDDPTPSNPYEYLPDSPAADEPIVCAEVVSGKPDSAPGGMFSPPYPHPLVACFWTVALMVGQIILSIPVIIVAMVVGTVAGLPPVVGDEMPPWMLVVLLPTGTLATVVLAIAIPYFHFGSDTARKLGVRGCTAVQMVLVVLSVLPCATLASEAVNIASMFLPHFNAEMFANFSGENFLLVFVAGCLLPGVGEELFFRGFIHNGVSQRIPIIPAVALTSLLFGLMHVDPVQATGAMFLGFWLHYLRIQTGSILAPIVLHILNNSVAFASMRIADVFPVPGLNYSDGGGAMQTPLLLLAASLIAAIPIAVALHQSRWKSFAEEGDSLDGAGQESLEQGSKMEGRLPTVPGIHVGTWSAIVISQVCFVAALVYASANVG